MMNSCNSLVCFVILHYKTIEDTHRCIESIIQLDHEKEGIEIIVVDNGSGNNTGQQLIEDYRNYKNVHIQILEENLGFSKGNNYGYCYALQNFNPDFMIVCNNDIVFNQFDIIHELEQIYNEYHFGILGPDIFVPSIDMHANPLAKKPESNKIIEKIIKEKEIELVQIKKSCYRDSVNDQIKKIKQWIKRTFHIKNRPKEAENDVVLQGACYILSKDFFINNRELFYPMDSFYYEEYFLYNKCKAEGLLLRYDPRVHVIHTGSSATKSSMNTRMKRKKFVLQNQIASLKQFIGSP